jgi:hypothetical protein
MQNLLSEQANAASMAVSLFGFPGKSEQSFATP